MKITAASMSNRNGDMARCITVLASVMLAGLSSACDATAEPDKPAESVKFPDMSSFAPVNPDEYMWQTDNPGRPNKITTYGFSTPDGIGCTFSESASASCTGNNFPAVPPAECHPSSGPVKSNVISTDQGIWQVGDPACGSSGTARKLLPPFHSLTVNGVTCGVDDKKMTACKDSQGRGFVLSPAWSGWIPKV